MGIFSRNVVIKVPDYIYSAITDSSGQITLESIYAQLTHKRSIVNGGYSGPNAGQHRIELGHYERLYKQASEAHSRGRKVKITT